MTGGYAWVSLSSWALLSIAFWRRRVKQSEPADLSEADQQLYYWGGLDSADLSQWQSWGLSSNRQDVRPPGHAKTTTPKHLSECLLHIVFWARRRQEWSSFVNTEGPISYSPPPTHPLFWCRCRTAFIEPALTTRQRWWLSRFLSFLGYSSSMEHVQTPPTPNLKLPTYLRHKKLPAAVLARHGHPFLCQHVLFFIF